MPVTPGYYQTYGIRLTRGRFLDGRDLAGAPRVAMVSESFARKYLPGLDPLTQRVKIVELLPDHTPPFGAPVEWQIVGVFHDVQYESHPTTSSAEVDVPFDQSPWPYTTVGVRTNGNPTAVTSSIVAAIQSVNPDYPMTRVRTMDQVVSESLVTDRFTVIVFAKFCRTGVAFSRHWHLRRYDLLSRSTKSRDGDSHGPWRWQCTRAEVGGRRRDVGCPDRNGRWTSGRLPRWENTEGPPIQRRRIGRASSDRCCHCSFSFGSCGVLRSGSARDKD